MSRALTMEEAAEQLRVSRRAFQDILKRHPFYYPNGNRKLFTPADIEKLRVCTGKPTETTPIEVLRNMLLEIVSDEYVERAYAVMSQRRDGFVYLVQCNDRVKIGYTGNWPNRLRVLRTACPYPVNVIASFPGDRELEKILHYAFADHRKHGEWFAHEGLVAEAVQRIEALE